MIDASVTPCSDCKEIAAWMALEQRAQDDVVIERKLRILAGINVELARDEARFWKRLSLAVIGCVVLAWCLVRVARWC